MTVDTLGSSLSMKSTSVSFSLMPLDGNTPPVWVQQAWTKDGSFKCSPLQVS
jgi:hypothetical protein